MIRARPAPCALTQSAVGSAAGGSFAGLGTFLGFASLPFAQQALRRLFGRRRAPRRRAMPPAAGGTRATFSVATFNLRGVMDRWAERQPLLRQCLHDLDADVLCFQECLTGACPCAGVLAPQTRLCGRTVHAVRAGSRARAAQQHLAAPA